MSFMNDFSLFFPHICLSTQHTKRTAVLQINRNKYEKVCLLYKITTRVIIERKNKMKYFSYFKVFSYNSVRQSVNYNNIIMKGNKYNIIFVLYKVKRVKRLEKVNV